MGRIHLALVALAVAGCNRSLTVALTQQMEAQNLIADTRVQLHRSAGAVQRAILADTAEVSADFAREAQEATAALETDRQSLDPILAKIGSLEALKLAEQFGDAFRKLQELDRTLLALAVEKSNVKAQRLSFGPAREAADAVRDHLKRAANAAPPRNALRAQLLAARVQLAVREMHALHAQHIAEADDAVMAKLEEQMADSTSAAVASLAELSQVLGAAAAGELRAAREQLERFTQVQRELVALSRENSDARLLAGALGDARTLTADCDTALIALQSALAQHGLQASR